MPKIKLLISGCNGRMGQVVSRMCAEASDIEAVAGFDLVTEKKSTYPVYADPMEFVGSADVLIDFSNAASLSPLLAYCIRKKLPAVLCTTGYSEAQLLAITEASKGVPLFRSGNMSLGINLLCALLKQAASVLGAGYDVEIIEKHHRMKVDAPSGTALMLADAVAKGLPYTPAKVYDRSRVRQKRGEREIGISSVRGGAIVAEHEVLFCGPDEVITFKHSIGSREVFANGALAAARFMAGVKEPGLYDMGNVIGKV